MEEKRGTPQSIPSATVELSLCFVSMSQAASESGWLMFSVHAMLAVIPATAVVFPGFAGCKRLCRVMSLLGLGLDKVQRGARMMWEAPSSVTTGQTCAGEADTGFQVNIQGRFKRGHLGPLKN